MWNVVFVGAGGALGAMARYGLSLVPFRSSFPIATLLTNLIGAFVIGVIVGMVEQRDDISEQTVLFLKTGVCGGFTTFSTFSLEAMQLLEHHQYGLGALYIISSVLLCILGVWLGKTLVLKTRGSI